MKVQFDPTCDQSQSPLIVNALEEASEKLKVKCQTVLDIVGYVLVTIQKFDLHIIENYSEDLRLRESLWEDALAAPATESDYYYTGQFYPNHPWFGYNVPTFEVDKNKDKDSICVKVRYAAQSD